MLKKFSNVKYVIAFIVLETLVFFYFFTHFNADKNEQLAQKTENLQTQYHASFNAYSLLSKTLFSEVISSPDIIEIFKDAYSSDEKQREIIRNRLFLKTVPIFEKLKKQNLRQLHFHLPDGTSFLRLHKPEVFGDKLFDIRPTVKTANTDLQYVEGFEAGRHYSGFRFVFPLFYKSRHIGSVDTSISFNGIEKEMEKLFAGNYMFVIKKDVVLSKVYKKAQGNFPGSNISDEYLIEKTEVQDDNNGHIGNIGEDTILRIAGQLKDRVAEDLRKEKAFAVYTKIDRDYYTAAFLPIKNIYGVTEAYIINFEKDPAIEAFEKNFYISLILATLMVSAVLSFVYIVEKKKKLTEEQNNLLYTTIDSLPYPFYVVDINNYTVIMANTAACNGELPPHITCHQLTHHSETPCGQNDHPCPLEKALETKKPVIVEHTHFDGQGNIKNVEVHGYPILDSSGNVVKFIEYSINITERKKLEEERSKTQKLESIAILAGGLAHDFNNLLQGILGYTAFARMQTNPGDKIFSMLSKAEESAYKAIELSNRLLTFSKGGEPMRKIMSISEVINESVCLLPEDLAINCQFRVTGDLYPVEIDEKQIKQAIHNIIANAQEAMPEGGFVRISAENVTVSEKDKLSLKDGNYVRLSISDQGIGIPEEHLAKIFDPYYTTKSLGSQKGAGLGLAICHSIIKKHDGAIAVKSVKGVGTTFEVYLPACQNKQA